MAEETVEQKQGADFTWLFALAAIVAVAGLMVWLYSTRDLVESTAMVPADAVADSAAVEAPTTETTDLTMIGGAPDSYVGQEVHVENVAVAAVLGERGFWAEIPGANPFLMVVNPSVSDVSWLAAGDTISLDGVVQPVTEELVNEWVENEWIRPGASAEASFATHYVGIDQAQP